VGSHEFEADKEAYSKRFSDQADFENHNHSLSGCGDLSFSYVVLEILKVDTEVPFSLELGPVRYRSD